MLFENYLVLKIYMGNVFKLVQTRVKTSLLALGVVIGFSAIMFSSFAYAANTASLNLVRSSSQYLSISNASSTGLALTGNFTLEAWVKLASQPVGNNAYTIVGKWDFDNSARSYALYYEQPNGVNYEIGCSVSHGGNTNPEVLFNQTLSTGTWYHVAAVYASSTGNCEVFVNGTSIGSSTTDTGGAYSGTAPFGIGAVIGNSAANFLDGKIDDVRVYNVTRTQSDIAGDYQQELTGSETGLVGYWKLNSSLTDATSNGNNLTNNNSATFSSDVPFTVPAPTINSFDADPSIITSGQNSQLSWDVSGATTLSIDQSVGIVTGTTTTVSPTVTTTYTLTASNQGYATSTASVTVTVNAAPTAVRKSSSQSVTSSTALQNDNQLSLQLFAGKTYLVDGLIIASSTNATPDIKVAFTEPTSSTMTIGYVAAAGSSSSGGVLQTSGTGGHVALPANNPTPIVIHGTVVAGTNGILQLQWAQNTSNAATVQVVKGSYLKVTEI
jgi:hypothetical protein